MHFLRYPHPLWFFQAGAGSELQKSATLAANITVSVTEASVLFGASTSTIPISVSAGYNISLSAHDVTSVQIELSSFAYNVSASAVNSMTAYLSAEPTGPLPTLGIFATITPVYTLNQTGQTSLSISAAYNVTASVAQATLAAYLSMSAAYSATISVTASLLQATQICVSAAYNATVTTQFVLQVQQGTISVTPAAAYGISTSMTPILVIDRGGGYVWSRKRKKRIPVKIGYPL